MNHYTGRFLDILTVIKMVVVSSIVFCLSMLFYESSFGRYQFAPKAPLLLVLSNYFPLTGRKRTDLDNDGFLEFERFLLVRSISTCVDLSIYKDMFNGSVCVCWSIDCRGTIINKSSISHPLKLSVKNCEKCFISHRHFYTWPHLILIEVYWTIWGY